MYNELLRGCLPGVPPTVPQDPSLEVSVCSLLCLLAYTQSLMLLCPAPKMLMRLMIKASIYVAR